MRRPTSPRSRPGCFLSSWAATNARRSSLSRTLTSPPPPRHRPQFRVHQVNRAGQVALHSTLCELLPSPSEQFPHFRLSFVLIPVVHTLLCFVMFPTKKNHLPYWNKSVVKGFEQKRGTGPVKSPRFPRNFPRRRDARNFGLVFLVWNTMHHGSTNCSHEMMARVLIKTFEGLDGLKNSPFLHS